MEYAIDRRFDNRKAQGSPLNETRDDGRKYPKAEGLFNKNTSERVSSNLDHRSLDETNIEPPFPMAQ